MTDRSPDAFDDDALLPPWAVAALRAPLDGDPAHTAHAKTRVMTLVRRAPRHHHSLRAARPRWARRRGTLAPVCGIVCLAVLSGVVGLGRYTGSLLGSVWQTNSAIHGTAAMATVVGDTVVPRVTLGGRTIRDTLLDTLWLVRFVFHDPAAREVAVVGDFNQWHRTATPLARTSPARVGVTAGLAPAGAWTTTVAVPRDAVRYAFVVDGRVRGAAAIVPGAEHPRPASSRAGNST